MWVKMKQELQFMKDSVNDFKMFLINYYDSRCIPSLLHFLAGYPSQVPPAWVDFQRSSLTSSMWARVPDYISINKSKRIEVKNMENKQ